VCKKIAHFPPVGRGISLKKQASLPITDPCRRRPASSIAAARSFLFFMSKTDSPQALEMIDWLYDGQVLRPLPSGHP